MALLLGLWGLSSGSVVPLEARQAGTQPSVKILYYEGEPRWEVKFLLQAVADDERGRSPCFNGRRRTSSSASTSMTAMNSVVDFPERERLSFGTRDSCWGVWRRVFSRTISST